ncbi:hypothetical protein [Vibrio cholerae]|uniref:hypothetical protein n=1 Tax=Vibrio cholerae TaxID=666 RepID=UPI00053BCE1B|nr:hypothetical protein [Vibrio cholerae]EGQ8204581.1 hypothetical protein [Vibrio cholerae]EGQ9396163.1 hypothetical protein [Vibrio cholerae]EGR0597729.1 hypothetical protein [Vibrio cholerae]EGR1049537.1 hypothetical protein [Vibrio cholerae]EGR3921920.1 hypothetical protein [Vibrio cholerae]
MNNSRIRKKYLHLMWEVDKRLEILKALSSENINVMYPQATIETEALQLRKTLELIAYSSLVAHKELYESVRADIAKDWHAKRIIKKVSSINPDFYPIPTKGFYDGKWNDLRGGFLTVNQFEYLYDSCGDLLHINNPFSKVRKNVFAFHKRVPEYVEKIESLLNEHRVRLPEDLGLIYVKSALGSDNPLHVWLYQRV